MQRPAVVSSARRLAADWDERAAELRGDDDAWNLLVADLEQKAPREKVPPLLAGT